jgi:alpha-L-arabinofuranosidase
MANTRSRNTNAENNDAENNNAASLPPTLEQVLVMLAQMLQTML